MSFDRLPSSSLKMCFAYCSIFPKGCKIVKKELIELWMAEEFLQPNGHDIESVGEMFSNILVHNSLLQVVERGAYGNALTYVMHDLVHDLASAVLCSTDDTNQFRYLFQGDELIPIPEGPTIYLMRTLIFRGEKLDTTMFSGYKSLYALTLDCDRVKVLPSSVRTLKYLKNLNVSRTRIESLPRWIDELHYLQTLNASTESLRELPSTLKYLTRLRHLYLCHDVELPAEMGGLTNLQALKFRVGEHKGYRIEELGSLNNLKQLSIYNLEKVRDREEAEEANISKKKNLTELRFEWDTNIDGEREHDEAVLEGLEPHPGLKMLKIAGFKGKNFPSWAKEMSGFDKLIEIALSDCQVCEQIPELGRLPNLKTLSLWRLSKVKSINFSFERGMEGVIFPTLETLLLTGMPDLEVIQDFGDKVKVFPRLVSLKIFCCNKLECLPSLLFQKAHGLKVVDIRHCSKLSGLPDNLHTLDSLESMTIKGCQSLRSIVKPESGGTFKFLHSLEIRDCQQLKEMVEPHAPLLKKVSMVELKTLQNLPKFLDSLEHSHSLAQLTIVGVPQFTSNINVWDFQKLRKLEIDVTMESSSETSDAIKKTVDIMLQNCCSTLGELKLTGLEIWDEVPESIRRLTALYSLELENFGVDRLPEWFEALLHLNKLCLSNFPELTHLPPMKRFTQLQEFHICNCPKIKIEYEGHKISHRCAIYVNSHLL
ncbi:putative disease resistance protein RGA3 [Salvia hispanica]|uniref:putative disease resistance protein RGA3 n=1 Tax=Salvia hispanica TaxID=49212 RepID=UPI0020096F99|nr:putative disease resistance protein RGA3 [Salvia hispanica]XP_047951032.1 putative disease resistance protein RGA3 [Salvia hispanica]XP_047951033.1 putative disease resistance protein RGA3 [Salvia hispanica]XP_047951034.1 putative disease resistance protein RGA3 [Salvia hispanica]XP_047951035.1 putative disease resistance protein RGA3 [Salvia hispanica]XP_047951037.1 putative disease resistance protein RGA3 [Salvia hispanica]XP_047951038.1 putative disease resistance protein RGA3 [Salvia h